MIAGINSLVCILKQYNQKQIQNQDKVINFGKSTGKLNIIIN